MTSPDDAAHGWAQHEADRVRAGGTPPEISERDALVALLEEVRLIRRVLVLTMVIAPLVGVVLLFIASSGE